MYYYNERHPQWRDASQRRTDSLPNFSDEPRNDSIFRKDWAENATNYEWSEEEAIAPRSENRYEFRHSYRSDSLYILHGKIFAGYQKRSLNEDRSVEKYEKDGQRTRRTCEKRRLELQSTELFEITKEPNWAHRPSLREFFQFGASQTEEVCAGHVASSFWTYFPNRKVPTIPSCNSPATWHGVQDENSDSHEEGDMLVDYGDPESVNTIDADRDGFSKSRDSSDKADNPDDEGLNASQNDANCDNAGIEMAYRMSPALDLGGEDSRKFDTFTLFLRLPAELRHKIWRMAMPGGRKVRIGFQFEKSPRSPLDTFDKRIPLPNILAVSKESRSETLRYMAVLFQDTVWPEKRGRAAQIPWQQEVHSRAVARQLRRNPQPITFDASRDWLWLPSQFLLRHGSKPAYELLQAMSRSCPQTLEKVKMLTIDCRWLQEDCLKMRCLRANDQLVDWCLVLFPNLELLFAIVDTAHYPTGSTYKVDVGKKLMKYLGDIKQQAELKDKNFKVPQTLVLSKEETKCIHTRISDFHTWEEYQTVFHQGTEQCVAGTWILARKHANTIDLPELGFYRHVKAGQESKLSAQSMGCCGRHSLEEMDNWDEFGSIVDGEGKLIHFKYSNLRDGDAY